MYCTSSVRYGLAASDRTKYMCRCWIRHGSGQARWHPFSSARRCDPAPGAACPWTHCPWPHLPSNTCSTVRTAGLDGAHPAGGPALGWPCCPRCARLSGLHLPARGRPPLTASRLCHAGAGRQLACWVVEWRCPARDARGRGCAVVRRPRPAPVLGGRGCPHCRPLHPPELPPL
jgi:hypothetical protein